MTLSVNDIPAIRKKIETAKTNRDQAQGALNTIREDWKKAGFEDEKAVEAEIVRLSAQIETDTKKRDILLVELEQAADWDKL